MAILTASTREGMVAGTLSGCAAVFKGIPYAAPPVGALRFCPPQPAPKREDILTADTFSAACPQLPQPPGSFYEKEFYATPDRNPRMAEDCLCLNIWTPAAAPGDKLPVALWIHGGAFDHGWGHEVEFDGGAFARRGVILVTINYRVGVFGFLAHPWLTAESDRHISGNVGILDQMAALRWVRDNIASFGGDPAHITVFGQSAGAMSTQTLVSSPLTRGMIDKAIFQSAGGYKVGLAPALTMADAERFGAAFTQHEGITSLDELRALPAMELLHRAMTYAESTGAPLPFCPCVDGHVLPDSWDALAEAGAIHDIPYMVGSTRNDIMVDEQALAAGQRGGIYDGCIAWSLLLERLNRKPAYVYDFSRALPGDDAGAFHSSELWYVFGTQARCWRPFTDHDRALSEAMGDAWCRFIRTGCPDEAWRPCTKSDAFIRVFA